MFKFLITEFASLSISNSMIFNFSSLIFNFSVSLNNYNLIKSIFKFSIIIISYKKNYNKIQENFKINF